VIGWLKFNQQNHSSSMEQTMPPRKIPKTSDKDESSQDLNSTVEKGSEYEKEDTPTSESETITKRPSRVDPTFDVSFKKLCSKKEVVISLLNTFLITRKQNS
jgi:hypothetical protein